MKPGIQEWDLIRQRFWKCFNIIIVIRGPIEVTCERAGRLEIEQGPMLTSQDNNDNCDSTFRSFDIL